VCQVILEDFGAYYAQFMPLMTSILENVGTQSMQDKKLRAKTFDTIGSIIIAVSDCTKKEPFKAGVTQITTYLCE